MTPELHEGDDYIPVSTGEEMAVSAYQAAYEEELKSARVDSLNMLYVAVTRAENNLYIYTSRPTRPTDRHVGPCSACATSGAISRYWFIIIYLLFQGLLLWYSSVWRVLP